MHDRPLTNAAWLKVYEDSGELPPASVLTKQMGDADQQIAELKAELNAALDSSSIAESGRLEAIRERDALAVEVLEATTAAAAVANWTTELQQLERERDVAREALRNSTMLLAAWDGAPDQEAVETLRQGIADQIEDNDAALRESTDTAEGEDDAEAD